MIDRRQSNVTWWSSAAVRRVRRYPRCSLNADAVSCCWKRRGIRGSISANPCCRSTCRFSMRLGVGRGNQTHRHAQIRRRVRIALARRAGHFRFRRRDGQVVSVCLSGAPLRVRRYSVPQRRAQRRCGARKMPRHRGRVQSSRGSGCCAAGRRTGAEVANEVRGRRFRPRHSACQPVCSEAPQQETQQCCDLRAFFGRDAIGGQGRRQYQPLLVRSWLVLVHSAVRRRHERRRGLLALLHEVAQDRPGNVFPRHDCAEPCAGGAIARCKARLPRHGHRKLFLCR